MFSSSLQNWPIVAIFDNEVHKKILKALELESKAPEKNCSVYLLMWGDLFFYHGEDGWCLEGSTLNTVEPWLDEHRRRHNLDQNSAFWFRIMRA